MIYTCQDHHHQKTRMIVAVFFITLLSSQTILSAALRNPCKLSTTEKCNLSDMKSTTVVYPGGNTGCINASVPFAFQVLKNTFKNV